MSDIYVASADQVALAAATAKTIMEVATPSTRTVRLISWSVEFDGVTATAVPVKVELLRASAVITGTTFTAVKYNDPNAPAALATARHTATAEGTVTDQIEVHRVPPTSGIVIQYPLGREPEAPISNALRIRCTAPAIVNATVTMAWEE
jgi:uncharacterized protein YccT (UPF0319 family)